MNGLTKESAFIFETTNASQTSTYAARTTKTSYEELARQACWSSPNVLEYLNINHAKLKYSNN